LAEKFLEDGKDPAAAAHPVVEAVDTAAEEFAVMGIVYLAGGFRELVDFGFPAIEMRADLFADEAADESFEFHGGFIISATFRAIVSIGLADGAEVFEHAETLAGGAFADVEALDEVVEGERRSGNEQEAVDFAD
jgi:hypothetical protein